MEREGREGEELEEGRARETQASARATVGGDTRKAAA